MASSIDKVALVTGASSGLGAASAIRLAGDGFPLLAIVARRADMLAETAKQCRAAGAKEVLELPADLSDLQAGQKVVQDAVDKFGRKKPFHRLY